MNKDGTSGGLEPPMRTRGRRLTLWYAIRAAMAHLSWRPI